MSTADWVVIGVVAVAGLYGISTGFLRGAFSLAGFAFGAYLGARLAPLILSDGSPYVPVVALGGAVLLGMLMRGLAGLLAGVLRTSIGVIPGMRLLDRLAGLVLGLVAGVFLCWAIGAVLLYVPGETELRRSVQRSTILSEINDVFPPERLLEELERVDPIGVFLGPPAIVAPPEKGLAKDPDVVRASKSVVRVTGIACGLGVEGSGWVVRRGLVVTNAHVVAGIERPRVDTAGGRAFASTVVAFDVTNDLAVLRVPGLGARPLPVADRSAASRSRSSATRGTGRSRGRRPGSAERRRSSAGTRTGAGRSGGRSRRSAASSSPAAPAARASTRRGACARRSSRAGRARRAATGFRSSSCARSSRRRGRGLCATTARVAAQPEFAERELRKP